MGKQELIRRIATGLTNVGVSYRLNEGTDITVAAQFLDAGWSTGEKRIDYQSCAWLDENTGTVFFWEFTKDTGSGFSFGGDSESSFQTGSTLYRKVKSVRYGPDGVAYEISLNIGAIVKAFKDAAKAEGWKFKVVLSKRKAMWPGVGMPQAGGYQPQYPGAGMPQAGGYPPQYPGAGMPQTPPPGAYPASQTFSAQAPQTSAQAKQHTMVRFHLPFAVLVLLMLVFFGFGGVPAYGWIIGIGLLAAVFFLRKRILSWGCGGIIAIWAGLFLVLLVLFGTSP